MKSICDKIGEDVILAIGPARGVGRRKWDRLAALISSSSDKTDIIKRATAIKGESHDRFDHLLQWLERQKNKAPSKKMPSAKTTETNVGPLTLKHTKNRMTITAKQSGPNGFMEHLADRIPDILKAFEEKK